MKLLKAARFVTFNGSIYSSQESEHRKCLLVAKKLNESKFAQYVNSLELGKKEDSSDYTSHDYYSCSGLMVNDKEYEELRNIGVRDLSVKGIYQDGYGALAETIIIGIALNACAYALVGLAHFAGVL